MGRTGNKINHIFTLLEKLQNGDELYAQDEELQVILFEESGHERNERTLRRYLQEIHALYKHIVITKKEDRIEEGRKVTKYKISSQNDVSNVLKFFLSQKDDLIWIIQQLYEQKPSLLNSNTLLDQEDEENLKNDLKVKLEKYKDIYLFATKPFELFEEDEDDTTQKIFKTLVSAVRERECRTLFYKNKETPTKKNIKCLKMIYSENNWYLSTENEAGRHELVRIRSLKHVGYADKEPVYPKSVLKKYEDYFSTFQNPMTLADKEKKTIRMKAVPPIAKYFKEDMKKFLNSQIFKKENDDRSVEFSVSYTQTAEIMPFLKRWIPHMKILSPDNLKQDLESKLLADLRKATSLIEANQTA